MAPLPYAVAGAPGRPGCGVLTASWTALGAGLPPAPGVPAPSRFSALLVVNPPRRPASILEAVEPDQRHLHEGGGPDGLETLRLVLGLTGAQAPVSVWDLPAA
jgi:hypothetical protein